MQLIKNVRINTVHNREEDLRALFIILLYPELLNLMDNEPFNLILRPYLEHLFRLDKPSREIFVNWLCKLDTRHFSALQEGLYNCIAIREDENA